MMAGKPLRCRSETTRVLLMSNILAMCIQVLRLRSHMDNLEIAVAYVLVVLLMVLFVVGEACKYHRRSPKLRGRFW